MLFRSGIVGKGPDSEPPIDLDTMLDLTAAATVDGVKFDGVDLFLFSPHVDIDASDEDLKHLAERVQSRGLVIGSVVAPVWPPTGGGSAMDAGKVIAGLLLPDGGQMTVNGRAVQLKSPRQALELGITMVAQELSLVPARSVVDNVFLGIEHRRGPLVLNSATRGRFAELVDQFGIDLPPDQIVGTLSVPDQQKVEILRALARNADLVVMDEPTARLTSVEAKLLRRTVRDLADRGVTVVYVSHLLDEVLAIADDVTIMRDGAIVRTGPATGETHESLIEGIIGRDRKSVV